MLAPTKNSKHILALLTVIQEYNALPPRAKTALDKMAHGQAPLTLEHLEVLTDWMALAQKQDYMFYNEPLQELKDLQAYVNALLGR